MNNIPFRLAGALGMAAAALSLQSPPLAARHSKHDAAAAPAKAGVSATESLGKSGAWAAYATGDKTGRVCYLVGAPQKSEPAGFARNPPMAMVTHRPAAKIANVVSVVEGYPLKEDSDVVLDVDGHKFELFTKDDSAWARTSELDRTIVATLAKSRNAVARGLSQKGPATTDLYALAGFGKALALIDKACGVKREGGAQPAPHPPARLQHKTRPAPG